MAEPRGPVRPAASWTGGRPCPRRLPDRAGAVPLRAAAGRLRGGSWSEGRFAYEGPLPAVLAKEVKVDITIRERLVCEVRERPLLRGYAEYADLPEESAIRVYALDEIVIEKVVALTDRARNEPRDLDDLWYLTSGEHVDLAMLAQELDDQLASRGRTREGISDQLARKEMLYRKPWSAVSMRTDSSPKSRARAAGGSPWPVAAPCPPRSSSGRSPTRHSSPLPPEVRATSSRNTKNLRSSSLSGKSMLGEAPARVGDLAAHHREKRFRLGQIGGGDLEDVLREDS
jgi:hypothetical protein